jgi:hypothetical protein
MLQHTVGYAVGCVTLGLVLVLLTTARLVMWPARTLPLPVARALGRRDDYARWGDRATERLMAVAGGPLRVAGWIMGGSRFSDATVANLRSERR